MQSPEQNSYPADTHAPLTASDAHAVDRWIDARARGADVGTSDAHAAHVNALLSLLASDARADRALPDVTLARVFRARAAGAQREPVLSNADLEALDALALADHDVARVPAPLRARAQRLSDLGAILAERPQSAQAPDLVSRTLARIQSHTQAQRESMQFESRPRATPRLRWADLVSVAAMVAIGSAVIMPIVAAARDRNQRTICNANLGQTALALSTYAGANRDALPMAVAGLGSTPWWDVQPDQAHSNSANLYTLAREGYLRLASLACPGNPVAPMRSPSTEAQDWRRLEEVSYSYQIMFAPSRPSWNSSQRTVVLADRSPVILAAVRHEIIDPLSNAPNHRYTGQHMLWNDGSVQWTTTPVLNNGDNIWLPRPIERVLESLAGKPMPLEGREMPAPNDVFLGP